MAKNRCPMCGATHDEGAERCRLCGQSLAPGARSSLDQPVARSLGTRRRTGGVLVLGVACVLVAVVAAVVFGVVQENSPITKAKALVEEEADGWSTQADPEGGFSVLLPPVRTREPVTFAGAEDGQLTAWTAEIGTDAEVMVGWDHISPPGGNGELTTPAAYRYLRDTVASRWMAAHDLTDASVTIQDGAAGGLPAITLHTTASRLQLRDQDAYGYLTLAVRGHTLYALQVLSIYRDAPQLARMAASLAVTHPSS